MELTSEPTVPQNTTDITVPGEGDSKELRYELRFSVSKEVFDEIEEAKVILSGKFPKGVKLEDILSEALESFLEKKSVKRRELRTAKKQRVGNRGVIGKEWEPKTSSRDISRQRLGPQY